MQQQEKQENDYEKIQELVYLQLEGEGVIGVASETLPIQFLCEMIVQLKKIMAEEFVAEELDIS